MNDNNHPGRLKKTDEAEPRSFEQLKERLLRIFTTLTEADVDYAEEKKDEMLERLQVKLGKTRPELILIFEII